MKNIQLRSYLKEVLQHMPSDWLTLTTHRLDIYNEKLAKTQFLDELDVLFSKEASNKEALENLPTAYDYIRLGHPLSSILEWAIAKETERVPEQIISFSSKITPILAILRKNLLDKKNTQILYTEELPTYFDAQKIRDVYGYTFEVKKIASTADVPSFNGSSILLINDDVVGDFNSAPAVDFYVHFYDTLGSILIVNNIENAQYISEIQHVRRRETIAMTPSNSLIALQSLVNQSSVVTEYPALAYNKSVVLKSLEQITNTTTTPLVASSGLSMQYAIMMGLVDSAQQRYKGKPIKFIVPPNCYGGTNDQARRVAACNDNIEIVDLPVDGDNDMVQSVDRVLESIAQEDGVPYIIAEIPTNPRVEVPDLDQLEAALRKKRTTATGSIAVDPVFILDQTFCPNVHFLGENNILSSVKAIAYASGSKFPSGGKCTAGYCVSNDKASTLMSDIDLHLTLCDNEATALQYEILATQLPSMINRIADAYANTRDFVNFITQVLPEAKINFVSEDLAQQGFTPSVFSLDLPTKGATDQERETYKRALNLELIHLMISEIHHESKYCVSYGQLKGCYWTIPATSTQGTTKEGDKDYIIRAALSPDMDLDHHKMVFTRFVEKIKNKG